MAAILASNSCCCCIGELAYHRKDGEYLSFSASVSNNFAKFNKNEYYMGRTRKHCQLQVVAQQTELPAKVSTNGRAVKMIPASQVKKRISPSRTKPDIANGLPKTVNDLGVVNGARLVKRNPALPLANSLRTKELPPIEGLKVLPSDEGFSWANENYNTIQRSLDVWSFVISLRVRVVLDNAKWAYIGGFSEDKQGKRRRKTASWLRESVLQLGPTFIKLGQLSSTRSDLFPKEFVDELAKLQDRVPAFSPSKAKRFIEKELGAPIHLLFKEFEDLPIAAASLGQVHRAVLHNGEKVVVKVQRPGLKRLFNIDLKNLKLIAEYFQRSETLGGPTRDWVGIYEECAKILYEEIDYINEGKNADTFRRDFRNIKWVRVPMVYWDYTATKVLTLEYVPGEGQLYTFMVLISEATTPTINMRWYLDVAGLKRSAAYLINGCFIFCSWVMARIGLFVYMSYHVYLHHSQVMEMHSYGFALVLSVPLALAVMNLMWFGKILKGLKKTLAKRK